jgi:hypothetical protein
MHNLCFFDILSQFNENQNCYFRNANELIIEKSVNKPDSIVEEVNRAVSLFEITKLFVKFFDFPVEQLIKILHFLHYAHTLKVNALLIVDIDRELLKNETLKYVSKTNKIKILILDYRYALVNIQFLIHLFPQL